MKQWGFFVVLQASDGTPSMQKKEIVYKEKGNADGSNRSSLEDGDAVVSMFPIVFCMEGIANE